MTCCFIWDLNTTALSLGAYQNQKVPSNHKASLAFNCIILRICKISGAFLQSQEFCNGFSRT